MIPVVINNRNRLSTLKSLIEWLEGLDVRIFVLDNDSSYPPLLEFYETIRSNVEVIKLKQNIGNEAIYFWGGHLSFSERYYVYTDSDVVPKQECPKDLIEYLVKCKERHKHTPKIGVSLEINDLPPCFAFRNEVIKWESKYWTEKEGDLWRASVDTTFAIYDRMGLAATQHIVHGLLRTDRPYTARHLPWYVDNDCLDEEEKYYLANANAKLISGIDKGREVGMWTQKMRRRKLHL